MDHEMKITDAVPQDARAITNVLHKTWVATYPNKELGITVEDIENSYKDSYSNEKIQELQDKIANLPNTEKRIVAKEDGLIVGVCSLVKEKETNRLKTIYVLPEFQGKGIGTLLWNEIVKFADPTKDTRVELATYNQGAVDFYKKLGFVDTGKRFVDESLIMKNSAAIPEMELKLSKSNRPNKVL